MKGQMLTIPEIAEVFQISKGHVYRLVSRVEFPSFRLSGRILVWTKDLEQWIRQEVNKEKNNKIFIEKWNEEASPCYGRAVDPSEFFS